MYRIGFVHCKKMSDINKEHKYWAYHGQSNWTYDQHDNYLGRSNDGVYSNSLQF